MNTVTFWRGYCENIVSGPSECSGPPGWAAGSCDPGLTQKSWPETVASGKQLKASLADTACARPRSGGSRLRGPWGRGAQPLQGFPAGSEPPVRPQCHMAEVPSPDPRTHAGRPRGKVGFHVSPTHSSLACGTPWGRQVLSGWSPRRSPPQAPCAASRRNAPLRLSSSVAREADFAEETGYFLLVFFFSFF